MVFSSVIFLFFFLPLVLAGYYLIRKDLRNLYLLLASLLFYYWGEGRYVIIMVIYMIGNYAFGIWIERARLSAGEGFRQKARSLLIGSLIFNLSFLFVYKYLNLIVHTLNKVLVLTGLQLSDPKIHLPLGISFFTFQAISYIMDIYRGQVKAQKNLINFSMYKALFPQLIAGPIVRYRDVATQVDSRELSWDKISEGVRRFIIGLGKKVLIANTVALTADQIFALPANELIPALAWLGMLCYVLQIYFDFSGYSDMAIGLGKMFGFDFLENFNYPYISRSIKEFWRRWHISLSTWFRDYLYFPLGGNRKGEFRTYFNLLTVFFLCGLWHGATWTFVLWGLWQGAFLLLERTKPFERLVQLPGVNLLYALMVVSIGMVMVRCDTFPQFITYMQAIFGWTSAQKPLWVSRYINAKLLLALGVGLIGSTPYPKLWFEAISRKLESAQTSVGWTNLWQASSLVYLFAIFYLSAMFLSNATYNPFIYFRF